MLIERDPVIDWKQVLLEFVRWGWKLAHVARAINVPPSTLKRWWYDGAEPGFEDGRALLKLYEYAKKRFSDSGVDDAGLQPPR